MRLANRIRAAYEQERTRYEIIRRGAPVCWRSSAYYDGRESTGPEDKGRPNIWLELARQFTVRHLDPLLYIHEQFVALVSDRAGTPGPLGKAQALFRQPPEPNQLLSPEMVAQYERRRILQRPMLSIALDSQRGKAGRSYMVQVHLAKQSQEVALIRTLADGSLDLSPLFTYCLARSFAGKSFVDLAKKFERAAALQFMQDCDGYKCFWREWLPKDFVENAAAIYEEAMTDLA